GLDGFAADRSLRMQCAYQREFRQRAILRGELEDLVEGVAGAFEELVTAAACDGDGEFLPSRLLQHRIGKQEGALRSTTATCTSRCTASALTSATTTTGRVIGGVGGGWIVGGRSGAAIAPARNHDARAADRACRLQRVPSFHCAAEVRLQRTGGVDRTWRTDVHSNLAAQIEPGELIVLRLGNAQSVPDEDHRRFESGREIGARVDGGVGAL